MKLTTDEKLRIAELHLKLGTPHMTKKILESFTIYLDLQPVTDRIWSAIGKNQEAKIVSVDDKSFEGLVRELGTRAVYVDLESKKDPETRFNGIHFGTPYGMIVVLHGNTQGFEDSGLLVLKL